MKLDSADFGGTAADAITIQPRMPGATDATPAAGDTFPLTLIARMARVMDQQNVDTNGRWLVVDPVFIEVLKDEDSRLFQSDWGGNGLQNGLVLNSLHGFKVYVSNNLPSFADIVRGMHLYGRKILRPEAISTAIYHLA